MADPTGLESAASAEQNFSLKLKIPTGWRVPDVPALSGSVMVTVDGLSPSKAPATMLVRAVPKNDLSFEDYCDRELGSMAQSFQGVTVKAITHFDIPDEKRWVAQQAMGEERGAIITLIEEPEYFVWFGLIIGTKDQLESAPGLYRTSLELFAHGKDGTDTA